MIKQQRIRSGSGTQDRRESVLLWGNESGETYLRSGGDRDAPVVGGRGRHGSGGARDGRERNIYGKW